MISGFENILTLPFKLTYLKVYLPTAACKYTQVGSVISPVMCGVDK